MIGERTAEEIKMQIGTAWVTEENSRQSMEVRGRDLLSGLPKTIILTSSESWEALEEPVYAVIDAVKKVLEITPPELSADIVHTGLIVTGGGSLLAGFDFLFFLDFLLSLFCFVVFISCVVIGSGKALNEIDVLENSRQQGARRIL